MTREYYFWILLHSLLSWLSCTLCDVVPHVNGYVRLTFNPPTLVTTRGTPVKGSVNISIEEDVHPQELLVIHPCCLDNRVARLSHENSFPVRNNTAFNVHITGNRLGRGCIKFSITRNSTRESLPSSTNATDWWWVAYSYDVIVHEEERSRTIGYYLGTVILGLFALNLVGIGGQLDGDEMVVLVKKPLAVTIGMLCRFGITPAVALGMVELIKPERNTSLGVLSLICSPSEGASNLLVMLAESDMTFSVTLTAINNFASVGMLPLWAILFETRIYTSAGNIKIPFKETFSIFGYIVISLILGFLLHKKCSNCYHALWTYLPSFTIGTLIAAVAVEIYTSNYIFALITKEILCACALIAASGYIFGAVMAFIAQLPHQRILVLSVETGTRTTFVTGLLLQRSVQQPEGDMAKTAPVLCALIALTPAILAIISLRIYKRFANGKDYVEPATVFEEDQEESLPDKDIPEVVGEKETCM